MLRGTPIPPPEERDAGIDGAERVGGGAVRAGAVAAGAVRVGVFTRPGLPTEFVRVDIPPLMNVGRGFTMGVERKVVVTDPFCRASEERWDISRMLPRGIPNPAELF